MKPAISNAIFGLVFTYAEPDAGEPVSNEHKHEDEEDKYCSSVLQVVVQLSGNSSQPQETNHLQGTE